MEVRNKKIFLNHKNKTYKAFLLLLSMFAFNNVSAQLLTDHTNKFTAADSLRGNIYSPFRKCYDINYYHLTVNIDIENQYMNGNNEFSFTAVRDFKQLQFDLFANLRISKITYKNTTLTFTRQYNAVFVTFPEEIKAGSIQNFKVYYEGKPTVAKNAPWDGGFVFAKDAEGKPFVATACQGLGASSWWPNKDQQADEVDSMRISIITKNNLTAVSNGRLESKKNMSNGEVNYTWVVKSPINNYGVTLDIAHYSHLEDVYRGKKGNLSLDYYVLPEDVEKAKVHFRENVKPMLEAFEYWFGPYPFYKDGYKLIETPFLGMEHQSAVAYGNHFLNGYAGRDLSATGWGLKWDFMIVHESGHEWFGNNITAKDIADMWIHESFTNYAESLFTEYWYGKTAGEAYVIGTRKNILNDKPIIGPYGVNKEGSGDMYYKGGNMLHTIRTIINNDKKWRAILTGLNREFGLKTVKSEDIFRYINQQSKYDFTKVFKQYLYYKSPPVLEIKKTKNGFFYRWHCDVANFDMPLAIETKKDKFQKIKPTATWQEIKCANFKVQKDYYILIKQLSKD